MKSMRHLSDEQVIELAVQEMDPDLRYQVENLMQVEADEAGLTSEEANELEDLRFARDEFLRIRTWARMEAGMRGLIIPQDIETDEYQ